MDLRPSNEMLMAVIKEGIHTHYIKVLREPCKLLWAFCFDSPHPGPTRRQ